MACMLSAVDYGDIVALSEGIQRGLSHVERTEKNQFALLSIAAGLVSLIPGQVRNIPSGTRVGPAGIEIGWGMA